MEEKPVVDITEEAKAFLINAMKDQGKDAVKLTLVFGRDAAGNPRFKYELQNIDGPDVELDLGEGIRFVVDGNIVPAVKGTKIDLKEGQNEKGEKVTGFIFDNPNIPQPVSACGGCPSSNGEGGCSSGGCSPKK